MATANPWVGNRPHPINRPAGRTAAPATASTSDSTPGQPTNTTSAPLNRTSSMMQSRTPVTTPYSYRSSMYGGLGGGMMGGYGSSMYGGGYGGGLMGGYGSSMYGGGYGSSMYGGGMYGGMYGGGMYGQERPSRGMMALERLAVLVNSLCFTAETLEQSMHSMHFFIEATSRIKDWAGSGWQWLLQFIRRKLKGCWNLFLFILGRKNLKEDDVSIRKIVLNVLLLFISIQLTRFLYAELTAPSQVPSMEEMAGQF